MASNMDLVLAVYDYHSMEEGVEFGIVRDADEKLLECLMQCREDGSTRVRTNPSRTWFVDSISSVIIRRPLNPAQPRDEIEEPLPF